MHALPLVILADVQRSALHPVPGSPSAPSELQHHVVAMRKQGKKTGDTLTNHKRQKIGGGTQRRQHMAALRAKPAFNALPTTSLKVTLQLVTPVVPGVFSCCVEGRTISSPSEARHSSTLRLHVAARNKTMGGGPQTSQLGSCKKHTRQCWRDNRCEVTASAARKL